jgi:selenocysteine-specific elongation factor
MSGLSASRLDKILDSIRNQRSVTQFDQADKRLIHKEFFDLIKKKITAKVASFHEIQPLKDGISKQELRSTTPGSDKLFKAALDNLCSQKELIDQGDTIRLASHELKLHDNQEELIEHFYRLISEGAGTPPVMKELLATTKCDPKQARSLLAILEKNKRIVKINQDIYFEANLLNRIKDKLIESIRASGGITPSKFQELTGSSRKYNIPLLEYFDRERVTLRVGDQRVLRGAGSSGGAGNSE